jgi:translation initiation factor IF-2
VKAADIAILVVAGDDGVMLQTKEAISHIKAANVPSIVAITKSDLPTSNPEKVKQQLAKEGILLEGQGGGIPVVLVSAKTGKGISDLLEVIVLLSQMANVGGEPKGTFEGVVIEAKRDRRKGVLATLIVRNGTLAIGEEVRAEKVGGKIRALLSDVGQSVKEATPGMPIEVLGFSNVPLVGSKVVKPSEATNLPTAQETTEKIVGHEPGKPRLVIILKADTQGALEAIKESIPTDDVSVVLEGSGDPTESDVLLAKALKALIIGFNVALPPSVAKLAETEGVIVKTYRLIYKLLEEL